MEVLEMNHGCVSDIVHGCDFRVLVDTEEVSDVHRGAEVVAVHGENETLDTFTSLKMESVIFDTGRDPVRFCIVGDLPAGVGDNDEVFLELFISRFGSGSPAGVMAHSGDTEFCRRFNLLLDTVDLLADFFRGREQEIRADRIAGNFHAGFLDRFHDIRRKLVVARYSIRTSGDDFNVFSAMFRSKSDGSENVHFTIVDCS